MSVRTSNFYLGAVGQFCRWASGKRQGRLPSNPLEGVERGNPDEDIRRPRRGITPEELAWVLKTVEASKRTVRGLTGRDRWFLYAVAISTGLRAKELRDLTPSRFRLGEEVPRVDLQAGKKTKNRKRAVQPIPAALVPLLAGYLEGKPADKPVWGLSWYDRAAKMLRLDLEETTEAMRKADPKSPGIPYKTEDGFLDFHGWRHSFITWLDGTGASSKTAQELARHSDPRLTLNTYTHARLSGLAEAVNKLPLPIAEQPQTITPEQLLAAAILYRAALLAVLGLPPDPPEGAPLDALLGVPGGVHPTGTNGDEVGHGGTKGGG
jgi:integrase